MKKKNWGFGKFILSWIISSFIIWIISNCINKAGLAMSSVVFDSILIGFLIAFCIFSFKMVIITSKSLRRDIQEGISRYASLIHVTGLNVPGECKASAILSRNAFTVNCVGNEFVLDISKIRNVDFQMNIDEKQYIESSLAKGIVGAVTFGVAGAVIGSAPKTKKRREVKGYAIISYENMQGNYNTIILRDEFPNSKVCALLVDKMKPMIKSQVNRVEL